MWFCTNSTKEVYKDMQANPNVEISVSSPAYAWIRLNDKAVVVNNMSVKEMCIATAQTMNPEDQSYGFHLFL